jgi:hypothetical protein
MMAYPQSRIHHFGPKKIPDDLREELEPIYAKSMASLQHIETRVRIERPA